MNRAERRAFNKQHKTNYTKQELETAMALARLQSGQGLEESMIKNLVENGVAHLDNYELVPDGTEVMLNYEEIQRRPQQDLTDEFKNWVEENKEKVFHLTREGSQNSLVCLEEDMRKAVLDGEEVDAPRWMFDLYSDIMVKYNGEWVPVWKYDQEKSKDESNG